MQKSRKKGRASTPETARVAPVKSQQPTVIAADKNKANSQASSCCHHASVAKRNDHCRDDEGNRLEQHSVRGFLAGSCAKSEAAAAFEEDRWRARLLHRRGGQCSVDRRIERRSA